MINSINDIPEHIRAKASSISYIPPNSGEGNTLASLIELCRQAVAYRAELARLEEMAATAQKALTRLEQELIPDGMLGLGLTSFTADGTTFDLKKTYKARITESKAHDALAYLVSNGFGDIIKAQIIAEVGPQAAPDSLDEIMAWMAERGMTTTLKNTIHPNTLAAFVREQAEAGTLTDEMADLLSVFTLYSVKVKENKETK